MSTADTSDIKKLSTTSSDMSKNRQPQQNTSQVIIDPRTDLQISKSQKIVAQITPKNISRSIIDLTNSMTETNNALTVSLEKIADAQQIFINLGYKGKFDDLSALDRFFRNKSLDLHPDRQINKPRSETERIATTFKELSTARDILKNSKSLEVLQNSIEAQEQLLLTFKEKIEQENIPLTTEQKERLVSVARGIQSMNVSELENVYTSAAKTTRTNLDATEERLSTITNWLSSSNGAQNTENNTSSSRTTSTESTLPDTQQETRASAGGGASANGQDVTATEQPTNDNENSVSKKLLINFQHQTMKISEQVLEPSLREIPTILNPQRGRWARFTNADLTNAEKNVMIEKIQSQIIDPFQNAVKQLYNPAALEQMNPDDQRALKKSYEKTLDGYKKPILQSLENYKANIISSNRNLADAIDEIIKRLELR